MKNLFILFFILLLEQSLSAQVYNLPSAPLKLYRSDLPFNWLKIATENALNKENQVGDKNLVFFSNYFGEYQTVLTEIAKNPTLSRSLYYWARPFIRTKIASLSFHNKIELEQDLKVGINYLKTADFKKEMKYFQDRENEFAILEYTDHFYTDLSKPFPSSLREYDLSRSVEAFLFRRLHEGANKDLMLEMMQDLLSLINTKIRAQVKETDNNGNLLAEYSWTGSQIEGAYRRYEVTRINNRQQSYVNVFGNYLNGKKDGLWKYYQINWETGERSLDHEIIYTEGNPQNYIDYGSESIKDAQGNDQKYSIVQNVNLQTAILDVTVFKNQLFYQNFNSVHDEINIANLYETQRRIFDNIRNPSDESAQLTRGFNAKDKIQAPRNSKTGNYLLYDELKRSGKDHALIIATDNYDDYRFPSLNNPIRDGNAISECLTMTYGFDCELLKNPTKSQIIIALQKYQNRSYTQDEQLFLYITGHGSSTNGEGYIVPKDGKSFETDFSHTSWLSYNELTYIISRMPCKHVLTLIDACYSGLAANSIAKMKDIKDPIEDLPSLKQWFYRLMSVPSRRLIASSAANRESSDGINHSPFCTTIIQALTTFLDKSFTVTYEDIQRYFSHGAAVRYIDFPDNTKEGSFVFVLK